MHYDRATVYTKHCRDLKFGIDAALDHTFGTIEAIFEIPFHHPSPNFSARDLNLKNRLDSTITIPQRSIATKFQVYTIFGVSCKMGGIIF